jgi:wyosine [tRNA(Phe)-imidazoG37] synthetase (radical SAM superfamily)
MGSATFGPVFSRRFGVSLGIDLSPSKKQCNFDCLYCELKGAKTTPSQDEIAPLEGILVDIQRALNAHKNLDVVTITANGEPTLYPYLDKVIEFINSKKADAKSLILSNGATICEKKTQNLLHSFDIVKLSLDSARQSSFTKLDRPHGGLQVGGIISCMSEFKKEFSGMLVLESLFVKNINDSDEDIDALKEAFTKISPDRIDIGSIARPPAYSVEPLSEDDLLSIKDRLLPLPVFVASSHYVKSLGEYTKEEIESTLKKRPLAQDEVDALFDESSKDRLETLVKSGKVEKKEFQSKIFYKKA